MELIMKNGREWWRKVSIDYNQRYAVIINLNF